MKYQHCIVRRNGMQWAVPIYHSHTDGRWHSYPYDGILTQRDDQGRVKLFGLLRSSSMILEVYHYDPESGNTALCDMWHYIPGLVHSSNTIPVSQTGSPAKLFRYGLDLSTPKKITGSLLASYSRDETAYRTDAVPPQICFSADPNLVLPEPMMP